MRTSNELPSDTEVKSIILKWLFDHPETNSFGVQRGILNRAKIQISFKEASRIVVELEDEQFIEKDNDPRKASGMDVAVSITRMGRELLRQYGSYSEFKEKEQVKNSNEQNTEERAGLNSKMDEILEHLKKHGLGQEIIFDELQELKDLYSKVPKKNWQEMLTGKLVSLGLRKLLSLESMEFIYKELTNNQFRLH